MAGVDSANQFPNSYMARAIKLGQSQMRTVDTPSKILVNQQLNVSIAAATGLTLPTATLAQDDFIPATYAVVSAIGGTLYATYDGSVPSAANYAIAVAAGNSLPVQGLQALQNIKVFGTTMSVSYWA